MRRGPVAESLGTGSAICADGKTVVCAVVLCRDGALSLGLINMWTGHGERPPDEPLAVTPAVAEQPSPVAPRPVRPAPSAPAQAPVEVVTIDYPWFVMMGSYINYDDAAREAQRLRAAGLGVAVVRSSHYERLTPDHFAIVLGANSRNEANQMLPQARALVPDAYIKAPR